MTGRARAVLARIRRRLDDEGGMTLVELLVALSILAIVMAGTMSGLVGAMQVTSTARHRVVAANLATGDLEHARALAQTVDPVTGTGGFDRIIVGSSPAQTSQVNGITYTIQREAEWVPQSATTSGCDSSSSAEPAYLRLNVSVTWPNMGSHPPVTTQSVITPPVTSYDPYRGHLAVEVRDRQGNGVAGHRVTVTGPAPLVDQRSLLTTTSGCAFFADLPMYPANGASGTYDVSVDTAGHVDEATGLQVPVLSRTLTPAATLSATFDYDEAATLNVTVAGRFGGELPPGLDVWAANTNLVSPGYVRTDNPVFPLSLTPLFPYTSGYELWAGESAAGACTAHDPAPARTSVASEPDDVVNHVIEIGTVEVGVEDALGEPLTGQTVTAAGTDVGCEAVTYSFGLTDSAGEATIALPWGDWLISAAGESQAVTLDPAAVAATSVDLQQ